MAVHGAALLPPASPCAVLSAASGCVVGKGAFIGTDIGMRQSFPQFVTACREQGKDMVLGELAWCPGGCPGCRGRDPDEDRSRMGGTAETPNADGLILVNIPLKSTGYRSRKNWIRISGFGSGRGSIFLLFTPQPSPAVGDFMIISRACSNDVRPGGLRLQVGN